jgi:hypothetical protein
MRGNKQQGKDGWNECEQASNKGRMDGMNASKQATREGWYKVWWQRKTSYPMM